MNKLYILDYERFTPNKYKLTHSIVRRFRNHELNFIYYGRKLQFCKNPLLKRFYTFKVRNFRRQYGLEINFKNVGGGIRLIHPWDITVNDNAKLGNNVTIFKGSTIGIIEHGEKRGCPNIGNNVTICANATVCGNVTIGDNVLICAGAFVNFDVPDNSMVIGNPVTIHTYKGF